MKNIIYFVSDIDDCVDNACTNGATCQDGVNQYLCLCPTTYTGTHCETHGEFAATIMLFRNHMLTLQKVCFDL